MKYLFVFILGLLLLGCSKEQELTQNEILENLADKEFDAFVNWRIFDRGSYHIFSKEIEEQQPTDRWIVINEKGKYKYQRIHPFKENNLTPLNGNTQFDLSFAVHKFFELDIDRLRYIEEDSGQFLLLHKNSFSFLYTYQDSLYLQPLKYLPVRFSNWEQKTSNLYIPKQN